MNDSQNKMVVKLYKLDASPPNQACMIACELFNVPVEFLDVNVLDNEHLKPEFVKINPLHTVPVLQDGDFVLHDSQAILMYVADVYGKQDSFYPREPRQRALVNQKLLFVGTVLFTRFRNVTIPLIIEGNKEILRKNLDAIEETYGFLEKFLSQHKYLAGNNITIADIAAFTITAGLFLLLDFNAQKYPKIQAWFKEIEKLPAVQKHHVKGHKECAQLIKLRRGF